jgi:DNA-directed RNA polymerase subunit RPC12/RpoP
MRRIIFTCDHCGKTDEIELPVGHMIGAEHFKTPNWIQGVGEVCKDCSFKAGELLREKTIKSNCLHPKGGYLFATSKDGSKGTYVCFECDEIINQK